MQQAGWFIFGVDTEVNLSRKQILIKEILWNNFKKCLYAPSCLNMKDKDIKFSNIITKVRRLAAGS